MQEGLLSLMQMAKTSAVLGRLAEEGIEVVEVSPGSAENQYALF